MGREDLGGRNEACGLHCCVCAPGAAGPAGSGQCLQEKARQLRSARRPAAQFAAPVQTPSSSYLRLPSGDQAAQLSSSSATAAAQHSSECIHHGAALEDAGALEPPRGVHIGGGRHHKGAEAQLRRGTREERGGGVGVGGVSERQGKVACRPLANPRAARGLGSSPAVGGVRVDRDPSPPAPDGGPTQGPNIQAQPEQKMQDVESIIRLMQPAQLQCAADFPNATNSNPAAANQQLLCACPAHLERLSNAALDVAHRPQLAAQPHL